MRVIVLAVAVALLLCWPPWAQADEATLAWDPPTHKVLNNDCNQQGDALTQADLDRLEYTLSYRIKGSGAEWTNVETSVPTATLLNLPYSTTYEVSVGAHWPGGAVLCATSLIEFTTGTEPAPGNCTNLREVNNP